MSFVDLCLDKIRDAVRAHGKKPLAREAGISDSLLRNAADASWDPRATTLRKLEKAAVSIIAPQHRRDEAQGHLVSNGKKPAKDAGAVASPGVVRRRKRRA